MIRNKLPDASDLKKQIMLTSGLVWQNNINEQDIDIWLSNFTGEVLNKKLEQHLALWLLANFVYYNENEVRHLCRTLFRDFLHHTIAKRPSSSNNFKNMVQEIMSSSIFYNLGRPGESGGFVLYYFRQENELPNDYFIFHPTDISDEIETVVFVDDVTLSSGPRGQASNYINETMSKYFHGKKSTLLTFIATESAKRELEREGIEVYACIYLNDKNKCFSPDSNVFTNHSHYLIKCREMVKHYGRKLKPRMPLGWNNSQRLFGFYYNTPDNTLPIFWAQNDNWKPILKRYDKNYEKSLADRFETFI